MPPGFGVRQSSGAFHCLHPPKRQRTGALQNAGATSGAIGKHVMNYDAIIIGGGPAGATAGILLARAGWRVVIVEKAAFPRRKVCGEFISATTWSLLDEMGICRE